jgi:hypothetical protein
MSVALFWACPLVYGATPPTLVSIFSAALPLFPEDFLNVADFFLHFPSRLFRRTTVL